MFCIYYFPVREIFLGAFVHPSLCVWMFFWPLTQIIKVVALRILYMFWTRDRRRGAHCHFISSGIPAPSHVYTNYCCLLMGSVCAPSLLITPHRNTSTVISFWHDISNNMPYTVMHGNRRHVCSGDSCFSRSYAAACFYHFSPLLISLERNCSSF